MVLALNSGEESPYIFNRLYCPEAKTLPVAEMLKPVLTTEI